MTRLGNPGEPRRTPCDESHARLPAGNREKIPFSPTNWVPTVSYTPAPQEPKDPGDPKRPTTARITIWIAVGAVGLYFLLTGIFGIVNGGS